MRQLSRDELRFLIHYRLTRLPRSILRDLQAGLEKRDVALALAVDRILEGFDRHEVFGPDAVPPPFLTPL